MDRRTLYAQGKLPSLEMHEAETRFFAAKTAIPTEFQERAEKAVYDRKLERGGTGVAGHSA